MKAGRLVASIAAVVVAVMALLAPAGTASAHAELVSSSPTNQAVLPTAPTEILLGFSEDVDPIDQSIRLVDDRGDEVEIGAVSQSAGGDTMAAPVPETLDEGTYVVGWQAVSADSHKVRGAFTFSVGSASATAPGVIEDIFASSSSTESESLLLGAGRLLSFGAIGVLLGSLFLAVTIVPELIGAARIAWLLAISAAVAVIGTVWMITAQAHLVSGSYSALGDVLDTQSGRWWLARIAAVAFFAMLIPVREFLTSVVGRVLVAVTGVGVLAVVAAGGHSISGDQVVLGLGATVVHLAAMAIWFGGLVLLVLGVPRAWFWWTASQFSPWALASVVALALTGSVNAWRQLGSIDGLTDSAYGRWLVVKLLLVLLVVIVASFSRRMARSDDAEDHEPEPVEPVQLDHATSLGAAARRDADEAQPATTAQVAPPALRSTVVLEIAGLVLILMATAGLVNSPPPPSVGAVTQSASAVVDERVAQVELEPAVTGGTEMHVYLTSPGGGLDRADEISVAAYLPEADLGPIIVHTIPAGPNHVIGADVDLPVAGLWSFDVAARYGEFDQIVFTVQIPVTD